MRVTVSLLVVGAVLMFASAGNAVPRGEANVERVLGGGSRSASTADMMTMVSDLSDGSQQLIVIDSRGRSMCVYQISRGQIALKSARNIAADFALDEFNNGGGPTPQEIRLLSEKNR
jgi:hypothetical protein